MYFKFVELRAVKGRVVGYGNNGNSYRVYNLATRRLMESQKVIFSETPSFPFPPLLRETSQQVNPPRNDKDDQNYITDDYFLRDLRNYTLVLEPIPGASADHIVVGGLSDKP